MEAASPALPSTALARDRLHFAAAKGREQLAIGLMFGLGLLLGLAVAPVIAAAIFLDIFNIFLLFLDLFGGERDDQPALR